jgi:hypothetical protein
MTDRIMDWIDLEFDRHLDDARLRQAWAQAFDLVPAAVIVIDDITQINPWTEAGTRIVLERRIQPGDFPLHVTAYLRGSALIEQVATRHQSLGMVQRLCDELACRALLPTEAIDPYEWLLITPMGNPVVVRVDPDRLDDENAFVITSRQKHGRQQAA